MLNTLISPELEYVRERGGMLIKLETVVSHSWYLKTRLYKIDLVVGTNHALLVDYLR